MMKKDFRFREIPYNYTSFSDKEIILKYFDVATWNVLDQLRSQRITGRSAKLLYEIIGDIFIIERNPYLFEDFLSNANRLRQLRKIHDQRFNAILLASKDNPLVEILLQKTILINTEFFRRFSRTRALRNRIIIALRRVTGSKNIHFSPFHRVLHTTDATDWRVEYPFTVVYPDTVNEISPLIQTARALGLSIIPRGGGTGLTGGAVPVMKNSLIINTEKLSKISEVAIVSEAGLDIPVITAEAGVVTDKIIEHCEKLGYVFATDPTSAWASTIGGNVAENAGGKKCVMWGTAIDNIYSYSVVDANGDILNVQRVGHPYRKILPSDTVTFEVVKYNDRKEVARNFVVLNGTDIRKKGLGKDITNKTLNGLPGIQKEGGDGIIVSAQFVLYKPFTFSRTLCIEFFGRNMVNAAKAIVAINSAFAKDDFVFLTALEHFDEKYVRAINYRNKSARNEIPKAVLLIDIESNDAEKLETACRNTLEMILAFNAEGIFAKDEREQKLFWNDRKHLGAIAKHTNAFKLNEDVVIPLERLPEFADFIELLNYEKETANYLAIIEKTREWLAIPKPEGEDKWPEERVSGYLAVLQGAFDKYSEIHSALVALRTHNAIIADRGKTILQKLQDSEIILSFPDHIVESFRETFHGYETLLTDFNALVAAEQNRRVIIATHMHAGDGNVHVNIPSHSSDYQMMQEADEAASLSMREAVRLGGVVSGEHGIGLTKLKFIDKEILDEYQKYKKQSDPDDLFNPGKLDSDFPLHRIYTPSFNLLECEAIILESTDIEKLSTAIASCVRCGKCKTVCNTHYPASTMMYNPRNKILAVGLITEAILFSAQTLEMKSFTHFTKLREIADHCTVCHKCQVPCPVKIDFGNVSLTMREQLVHRKKTSPKLFTATALFYLGRKKYVINKLFRLGMLNFGYSAQRLAAFINKPIANHSARLLPKLGEILRTPFPKSGAKSLREVFKLSHPDTFYSFENTALAVKKSVVYFPGCGSERMFPEISMATVAMLYNAGIRVVIPHAYLCCGYPFLANGKTGQADLKSYENRVLFHRIADTIGYMNIDAVLVSCGTCHEMLAKYEIGNIFDGAVLMDVNEYIMREKLYSNGKNPNGKMLYHEPCHNPLKHYGQEKVFASLYGDSAQLIPDCCGEAGTLALSRPDISGTLRERKGKNIKAITDRDVEILTTCPSCVLGLSKAGNGHKVSGKSMIVYNAEQFIGSDWKKKFVQAVKKNGVEKIIF